MTPEHKCLEIVENCHYNHAIHLKRLYRPGSVALIFPMSPLPFDQHLPANWLQYSPVFKNILIQPS